MNYYELLKREYMNIQTSNTTDEIVNYCSTMLTHEWIEESDMLYFKEKAFIMNIDDIIQTLPSLNWAKIAYGTIKRRTGTCCHFSALLSAILAFNNIENSIAVGSCFLTKGKYSGMQGIHYWVITHHNGKVVNIDLCNDNPVFLNDELLSKNLIFHHKIQPFKPIILHRL